MLVKPKVILLNNNNNIKLCNCVVVLLEQTEDEEHMHFLHARRPKRGIKDNTMKLAYTV